MPEQRAAWESTPLGKVLNVLGYGEQLGTGLILRPLAEAYSPSARERLAALEGPVYAGDVLEAVFPTPKYPSPVEKAGRALASTALGMAVDPLSYLTLGGLTSAGRVAQKAGQLAGLASEQAKLGQRALVSVGPPFSKQAAAVIKAPKVFRAGEVIQSGKALQTAAEAAGQRVKVLNQVGLPQLAKFFDTLGTTLGQKFGVNIGADPMFMRSHQELFSKITGGNEIRAGQIVDTLEPSIHTTAKLFASRLGISEQEALNLTRSAVIEATDAHPYITLARNAKTFTIGPTARTDYDKARRAIINQFGLPATWGGPASITDTELIRNVRDIAIARKRINSNILAQDTQRLGHELKLTTHPDAGYSAGILSKEVRDWLRNYKISSLDPSLLRARAYAVPPAEHIAYELRRTSRVIDPVVFDDFAKKGLLDPMDIRRVTKGKSKILRVNPQRILEQDILRPVSRKTLGIINKMVDAGRLSLDEAAENYVGKLAPSIPRQDFNRWVYEHGWGIIPPKTITNFFEPDPTIVDIQRGIASDRAVLSKEWFDWLKSQQHLVLHETQPVIPPNWIKSDIPELAGYYMRPDEAKFLRRFYEADINLSPALKNFMHVFHQANMGFKGWALSIFPAYHTRNFVGSMWNYHLGSNNVVDAIANIHRSISAWAAIRGGKRSASRWTLHGVKNPVTGKDYTAGEIWREVQKQNGWGVGFVSQEPGEIKRHVDYIRKWGVDDPERELMRMARAQWRVSGRKGSPFIGPPPPSVAEKIKLGLIGQHPWIESGFRIGTYVDDRIRMAHVIQRLRDGATMDDAVRSMKKHFFDYHQLSPFEKTWAKEVIPFYAWSRKNIPFQLEMLVRRPDRIARFNSMLQGWEATEKVPNEEKLINDWMLKNFPLRLRKSSKGKYEYFILKNWLPLADIQDLFHILDWATQGLTPWVRVPLELIANSNFFTDRKIDYANSLLHGERTRFGTFEGLGVKGPGVAVPNKVAHVIKSIRLTNTLHQLLDNPQDLDVTSQILRAIAGRTYPLDEGRSAYQLQKDFAELDTNMKHAIRSAVLRHDNEAVKRLVEQYLQKRQRMLKKRGLAK